MSVTKEFLGTTPDGKTIDKYWIENKNKLRASVINYGAILVDLIVPNAKGEMKDIVLGYDNLEAYLENGSFFGATVGPNANRIGNAAFTIDGVEYKLAVNDGPNNLHSDYDLGYHKCVWDVQTGDNFVIFSLEDKDGNLGFPGNKKLSVVYTLTDDNELKIHYMGSSDKKTIFNPTNHTYFNLAGHDQGSIINTNLKLNASCYTPVVAGAIPTGEIASVKGTPFDFTAGKKIGVDIEQDNEQLHLTGGFDHNWVIDNVDGSLQKIAEASCDESGIVMEVFTTLPGVQFYAGNMISTQTGKGGAAYGPRTGFCLETQYFPDAANKANFPSAVFGPERKYDSTTVYQFSTKQKLLIYSRNRKSG